MSEQKLSEDQMNRLEQAIERAGSDALEIMNKIRAGYMDNVGGNWTGSAAMAALQKGEDFSDEWKRMQEILTNLLNGVTQTKTRTLEFDADEKRKFEALNLGDDGGLSPMATSFSNRMGG